jgi:tripartite-type tricarboxylate transporter receptor subunit TctC
MMRTFLFVAALLLSASSLAQWPSKPIHAVVPSPPGGPPDLILRMINGNLGALLGQPVIVENRAGAGGVVGTAYVAKAAPDGYTWLFTTASHVNTPPFNENVPFDPVRDFTHVTLAAQNFGQALIVPASSPAKSVADLVEMAKKNPGKLNYGSAGPASSSRLAFELFKDAAGIQVDAVHYKGGGPAINDLVAGTVQVMLIQAGGTIGQNVKAGKLVGLATSGRQRSPHFPDLPTIGDFYPGFETTSWVGAVAPAGTPGAVIEKLNGSFAKILAEPDVKTRFDAQSAEIVASTPEQFGELIKSESAKWGKVIREKNIRID